MKCYKCQNKETIMYKITIRKSKKKAILVTYKRLCKDCLDELCNSLDTLEFSSTASKD